QIMARKRYVDTSAKSVRRAFRENNKERLERKKIWVRVTAAITRTDSQPTPPSSKQNPRIGIPPTTTGLRERTRTNNFPAMISRLESREFSTGSRTRFSLSPTIALQQIAGAASTTKTNWVTE